MDPLEGYWTGDHVVFQVNGGAVIEIGTKGMSCKGDDGCFAENNQFFPGSEVELKGDSFSSALENDYGIVELAGAFTTSTHAEGTYSFSARGGCCSVQGLWRAEFLDSYPEPEPDVVEDAADFDDSEGTADAEDTAGFNQPEDATEPQKQVLAYANTIRDILGIPLIGQLDSINAAAQAHAEYFVEHCSSYLSYNVSPHDEVANWDEGFSGATFFDRMIKFGFSGLPGWEVMAFMGDPVGAVDGWMATLYHRIPFVNPYTLDCGYGIVQGKGCYQWAGGVDVMDFSRSATTKVVEPVAWPYDGQTGVNPSWDGMESPQPPLPKGHNYPSGPIITFTFPSSGFKITTHELHGPSGEAVEHQWVTPDNDPAKFLQDTVSLYSLSPLKPFSEYSVKLTGTWKGKDHVWEWGFVTGAVQRPF